jgi:hypothetical protein
VQTSSSMAPHLSPHELNVMHSKQAAGKTPREVHEWLVGFRSRKSMESPNLTNVRKALKGKSYRRGAVETRGRKAKLSMKVVQSINKARKVLLKKANNEKEVTWDDCRRAAKAPACHPTTVARSFAREGFDVKARRPREKPQREKHHVDERLEVTTRWSRYPENYWSDLDLIIDNKRFKVPTFKRAVKYLKEAKIRRHLRTRSEGVKKECVKPSLRKQKMNPGGSVHILCGISRGKVVLWHNVGRKWNGDVAAACYRGPVLRALRKHCGEKPSYRILEDNDPVGYKSAKGEAAKRETGITAIRFPRHSPDLNPLDFCIWNEIERKMVALTDKPMSVKDYDAKLRRVARTVPAATISNAVRSIRTRAKAIAKASGHNIARD